jgi:hypothetical protein
MGKPFDTYAEEALFAPLGVTQYEWIGPPKWDPHMPPAASGSACVPVIWLASDLSSFTWAPGPVV